MVEENFELYNSRMHKNECFLMIFSVKLSPWCVYVRVLKCFDSSLSASNFCFQGPFWEQRSRAQGSNEFFTIFHTLGLLSFQQQIVREGQVYHFPLPC